jgi:hypothetical protein
MGRQADTQMGGEPADGNQSANCALRHYRTPYPEHALALHGEFFGGTL